MGSDQQSNKKCGEILINIKKNNKTKSYTFKCEFCNTSCGQLKKFSLHLEEKHSVEILDEPMPFLKEAKVEEGNLSFSPETEVKIELMEEIEHDTIEKIDESKTYTVEYLDPLAAEAESIALKYQHESEEYEESVDDSTSSESENDYEGNKDKVTIKEGHATTNSEDTETPTSTNKLQCNVNETELTVCILKALEKQPALWDVKSRSHNKIIRQARFQDIANEINENLKIQIKWEFVRNHVKDLRTSYSYEYDKQKKGENYEMPWYSEHMGFLKENIEALIKHRFKKKKYKRLKTLDDAHIPIFIECYKNCEILWQVNNINFVLKTKKTETLKQMIQELKTKHNVDINLQDMQRSLDYINRLYSEDRGKQLQCEIEKKEFKPNSKYYHQLSFLSESQGPFLCCHCQEIITKFEKYHIHVSEHTKVVPFKCALCEVRFKKLSKYIVHAKRHLGLHKYHCDICGKGYQFRSELEWHVRQHTGEEPYLCEICGASFRSQNSYDNHIRRHEKRFRYECHICKHGFNHPHKLKSHVKAHLNIRDILCNVCGKGFTAMNHLRRHQQIHSGIKRYKCDVCEKAFAQDAGLRAHRKQHDAVEGPKNGGRKRRYNYDKPFHGYLWIFQTILYIKMNKYKDYIKCGEIYKSPSINPKEEEYVFKCLCYNEEHYINLEKFILPLCSNIINNDKLLYRDTSHCILAASDSQNEKPSEDVEIKYEDIAKVDVDPLNILKIGSLEDSKQLTEIKEEFPLEEPECLIDTKAEESLNEGHLSNDSENEEYGNELDSDNDSLASDDSNSPLFVHNFIKSKRNVMALIEAYKNQPQLWNQKYPQFALKKKHDKYLEEIREELKKQMNLSLTCSLISAVITYLCRKYRQDLKRLRLTELHEERPDDKNPPSWFFMHLEFLKPIVEKTLVKTLNSSRRPNLEQEQIIQMLDIYRRLPYLWNTNLIENVCKNKRLEALAQMRNMVETEMQLKLSENLLKNNILFFHNHFTKLKRLLIIEGKTPKNDIYYKSMEFLHDHVGPFKCHECSQVFKSPLAFKVHRSQHDGLAAIRCSLCNKAYNTSGPYISHARRHCEDLNEECKQCGKKFLMVSDLKIHMRSHTGAQPYCCEICGVSFRHSTSLNVHRRRHEKQYLHKCPICSKGFYKKDRMNDHIRSHNNIRDFACKICGKAFKTRKTLKQHEVIHNDSRNHVCSLCGKAFKLKVGLLQHMRTHGGHL
ncbi:uncharacterized protein LOC106084567 [Stomoxys calcitrans]|uniref:Protein krueppel n=1 Tax=Stomoxys calcitrans TaxID=35570 RepID=A0A1I8NVL4_STOCA|nr:uncharacterized protein LOC106084567 [Stomoxys calcitrans]